MQDILGTKPRELGEKPVPGKRESTEIMDKVAIQIVRGTFLVLLYFFKYLFFKYL